MKTTLKTAAETRGPTQKRSNEGTLLETQRLSVTGKYENKVQSEEMKENEDSSIFVDEQTGKDCFYSSITEKDN